MVHNGIEYGMMQSIAEGFNLMKNGPYKGLNMQDITTIYQNGSVVTSRLVGWLADAFAKYGNDLRELSGAVGFTGEGAWTAEVARKFKLPIDVINDSVEFRKESQKKPSFAGKVLTGMRNQFGGHSIEKVLLLTKPGSTSPSTAQAVTTLPPGCRNSPSGMKSPSTKKLVSS